MLINLWGKSADSATSGVRSQRPFLEEEGENDVSGLYGVPCRRGFCLPSGLPLGREGVRTMGRRGTERDMTPEGFETLPLSSVSELSACQSNMQQCQERFCFRFEGYLFV